MSNLNLDLGLIARGREAAGKIAEDTQRFIDVHSTVTVERTIARLFEIDGVDDTDVPLPNLVIENIKNGGGIRKGAAYYIANAVLNTGMTPQEIAERVAAGELDLCKLPEKPLEEISRKAEELAKCMVDRISSNRNIREKYIKNLGEGDKPYIYVIVATGNIYEDVVQAQSAAKQGADIIAVKEQLVKVF
jgi:beta-lysine 5,6-aminomutase alpha subunit